MGPPGVGAVKRVAFPSGFLWGSATSAHQVEGNCDRNHWWAWEQEGLRAEPPGGYVRDGSVSGIACDYYHRFDEDHRLAAMLGHQSLRISIEWSRDRAGDAVASTRRRWITTSASAIRCCGTA